jgi:prepilin-type N-terminal cleavage/methylation domain-containing protein
MGNLEGAEKMPTFPRYHNLKNGFSLIEMLVVLGILALGAMLLLGRAIDNEVISRSAINVKIAAQLTGLRQTAISQNRLQVFDPNIYGLKLVSSNVNGEDRLLFYSDGSSNGGELINARSDIIVSVDWLTGRIRRAP